MTDPGTFSNFQVHQWLAGLSRCWVALHFDNPLTTSAYSSEVIGGAYGRQRVTMSTPANRTSWNVISLNWSGLPTIQLTHIGFWDLQYNGNLLAASPLTKPIRVLSGGSYALAENQLALSFRSLG